MIDRFPRAVGCIAATIALFAAAVPASANSAPVPMPDAGMVEAVQRDLGLTAEQAIARLDNEEEALPVEAALRKQLGDGFAGSWLTGPTSDTLNIATTNPAVLDAITAHGGRARLVTRSMSTLTEVAAVLGKALTARSPDAGSPDAIAISWGVDVISNTVVVSTAHPEQVREIVEASGVDVGAVQVKASADRPTLRANDLRGGDQYFMGNFDSNGEFKEIFHCTIGFPVSKGTTSGFLSAGHCHVLTGGNYTRGFDHHDQGTFLNSSFPDDDYSYVSNTWPGPVETWQAQPWVMVRDTPINVTDAARAVTGAAVCRSGAVSGWHCGQIRALNESVMFDNPGGVDTVNQLIRTNVCASVGDSGGPLMAGTHAQGLTSGAAGDCTVQDRSDITWFQPVNEPLGVNALTLKTVPVQPSSCTYDPSTSQGYLNESHSWTVDVAAASTFTFNACLDAPTGTDFDLYLEKKIGVHNWTRVAAATGGSSDETLTYTGGPGFYRYRVWADNGAAPFLLNYSKP